ncbi:GCN5-related N-acetyltransferase 10, chloroplastic-like isoform X2 [Rhododendron vialii]|uniref:GCN5-related N-acetyltransferase 10, chloroplastic-like isoform X2 n=1 Tax=Rhododendron vialii TaxID=182163 RepID=UPI00265F54E5|nr:GCN5-related N-acetyltransferase 10, chloroplastic-like isoform X2 [Rhododendron vialii]
MAHAKASFPSLTRGILCREISCGYRVCKHGETNLTDFRLIRWNNTIVHNVRKRENRNPERERELMVQCSTSSSPSSTEEMELDGKIEDLEAKNGDGEGQFGDLVREYGWKVRRMVEEQSEMRKVAQVQAEAFHEPVFLFNDLFFQFFEAEVLSGLLYKLQNSAPNRYACLVAESNTDDLELGQELVGVVDVTALRDEAVLRHLSGAKEYLYVSGIAVLNTFRRRKVASALLKACDMVSILWGFEYLVLRAYEDDLGALKLYGNAGYRIVSADPPWMTTWIGRKRRILMIKRHSSCPK